MIEAVSRRNEVEHVAADLAGEAPGVEMFTVGEEEQALLRILPGRPGAGPRAQEDPALVRHRAITTRVCEAECDGGPNGAKFEERGVHLVPVVDVVHFDPAFDERLASMRAAGDSATAPLTALVVFSSVGLREMSLEAVDRAAIHRSISSRSNRTVRGPIRTCGIAPVDTSQCSVPRGILRDFSRSE